MKATISSYLIKKIIDADHHDPFSILGMHPVKKKNRKAIAVRAYCPDAAELYIISKSGCCEKREMTRVHGEGFFEVVFEEEKDFFPYKLELHDRSGNKKVFYDPYSFPPVLSDYDLHLISEGKNQKVYDRLGAHKTVLNGVHGFLFAVWAPNAVRVSIVGDFNCWDGRKHVMRVRGSFGVWELFIPGMKEGELYKYEIKSKDGKIIVKADPYAFCSEVRPKTASVTHTIKEFFWNDKAWMEQRDTTDQLGKPLSIYEVHLGSWMRNSEDDSRVLTYQEAGDKLVAYVLEMGYTHVQFLPLASHPYDPSWGYQVTGYFSPTARFGSPDDLMGLVDKLHVNKIGVLLDWVPAHFPTDSHALANFDGTCLYEYADPKKGKHPDWGTLVFNFGRNEVRNFLISNALFWLEKYHVDGLRVDAVASMLYLDYSRKEGEWVPNAYGGRENLEAVDFLKRLNEVVYSYFPGVLMIAEESTSWPAVSRPTCLGGLGFAMKWNMGWMHDVLQYMSKDPVYRCHHQGTLTFALLYTFYENFILPFSHDEVVHGKGSILARMPGDDWQKFANMRLLLGYMFGHPGKKHLFMGIDIGQWSEWDHNKSLDWHLLEYDRHHKLREYVKALNHLYCREPALYELDFDPAGFEWIDFSDSESCVISFMRRAEDRNDILVFICNFTPVSRIKFRVGVPFETFYKEVLNSDSDLFWGSNLGNFGGVNSEPVCWNEQPYSVSLDIPPLGCLVLKPDRP